MRRIILTFGLIAGGIMSAMLFATIPFKEQIGFDKGAIVGYSSMVLAFLFVYFGIRTYRDTVAGGRVSFGRAVQVGALISLVATVCYVATWQVVYTHFMPDFMERYAEYSLEQARAAGASAAELDTQRADMAAFAESYRNPFVRMGFTALEPLPVALVFTLVSAALLSRRKQPTG